ncbi:MAG: serine hydrolase [Clostridia bacterium]|nr:serine hydrolase [Clostridia bacterium]
MEKTAISLPRVSSPEKAGVSGKIINEFMDAIESTGIEIHSFMVIRHGKVAAECFRAPFTPNRPHTMYSISKTVTATAIGIAIDENLLSLDDKVRDFFPEITEKIKDERLNRLLVRHLLTMTSGKDPSVFADKTKGSWAEYFFKAPWYNEPGEEFKYINENIYILSAIIKKVSGQCVRDFLKPRLFDVLGIDYPFWETDGEGIEAGGWGLYLKTEDLAKIMLVYSNKGLFGDTRIFSEKWAEFAPLKHADNSEEFDSDAKVGYGCCLWRCAPFNGYRADGMFSQFGIVFQDYDAVLAVTSAVAEAQVCRDLLWKFFPRAFEEFDKGNISPEEGLYDRLKSAVLEQADRMTDSYLEEIIEGKTIHFRKKILLNIVGFPMSMLPLAVVYMTTDRAGNIDNVIFRFKKTDCTLTWDEGDENNTIPVGLDGRYRYGTMTLGGIEYKVCSTGLWVEGDRLVLQVRPIETIGKRTLDFKFKANGKVLMRPSSTPSVYSIAMNLAPGFKKMIGGGKFADGIVSLFRFAPNIIEPTHKGKIKS